MKVHPEETVVETSVAKKSMIFTKSGEREIFLNVSNYSYK